VNIKGTDGYGSREIDSRDEDREFELRFKSNDSEKNSTLELYFV
jgi:hypothetical protein